MSDAKTNKNLESSVNKKMSVQLLAELVITLCAMCWGGRVVAAKHALNFAGVAFINAGRFILAVMFLYIFFYKKISYTRNNLKVGILLGLTMMGSMTFQTAGLRYTDAGKAAFLGAVYLIFVPFITWIFFKRRPKTINFISAIICIIGVAFMSVGLTTNFSLDSGDAMILLAAVFSALWVVIVEWGVKLPEVDSITIALIQSAICALCFILVTIYNRSWPESYPPVFIGELLFLSLGCVVLANVAFNQAMKYSNAAHAAILLTFESVFATVFGILLLGEAVNNNSIFGAIFILASGIITVSGDNIKTSE